jgi:hypothetical protein
VADTVHKHNRRGGKNLITTKLSISTLLLLLVAVIVAYETRPSPADLVIYTARKCQNSLDDGFRAALPMNIGILKTRKGVEFLDVWTFLSRGRLVFHEGTLQSVITLDNKVIARAGMGLYLVPSCEDLIKIGESVTTILDSPGGPK